MVDRLKKEVREGGNKTPDHGIEWLLLEEKLLASKDEIFWNRFKRIYNSTIYISG